MLEISLTCTYIAHISVAEPKILKVAQGLWTPLGVMCVSKECVYRD